MSIKSRLVLKTPKTETSNRTVWLPKTVAEKLCEQNGYEIIVFHSLRHLSTGYKLKMTNGDVKSVQGDTGHAEAEMVTDVYSEIIDEDRRYNAQKMDEQFYSTLNHDSEMLLKQSASK